MIAEALELAAVGWPIFPLAPRGKQPLGHLVPHGLKDATTDPELITEFVNPFETRRTRNY